MKSFSSRHRNVLLALISILMAWLILLTVSGCRKSGAITDAASDTSEPERTSQTTSSNKNQSSTTFQIATKQSTAKTTTTSSTNRTTAKSIEATLDTKKETTATMKTSPTNNSGHKHNYNEWVVGANCMEGGYTKHICSCGDVYLDNKTPKTNHKYGWKLVKSSTTEETGVKEYRCEVCGDGARQEVILKKKAAPKIDPKVKVGVAKYTNQPTYSLGGNRVIDGRTWGEYPSISVYDRDCMKVIYYNKQGEKVTIYVTHPELSSHHFQFKILDDGTYVCQEIDDWGKG